MKKNLLLPGCVAVLLCGAGTAVAGGAEGSLGVGAEFQLSGFGGASVNYDAGPFHVGAFFGMSDFEGDDNTIVDIGGRFYFHVHSTAMADFGVGGSLGLAFEGDNVTPDPDDEDETYMSIEPGVQIRAFVASNVALSFTTGIAIALMDADGFTLGGQVNALAGVHYYFF